MKSLICLKDNRESQRKIIDQLQSKLKTMERQRTELTSICTKQSHLIDNLRRQKVKLEEYFKTVSPGSKEAECHLFILFFQAHLEVNHFVQTAEVEFDNILDWCLKGENKAAKVNS